MLLVEDNADTREMYAWCLRAAGWFVEEVTNGAEALYLAPFFEPDVIVMDLNLPVVGGLEAVRRLRAEDDTKHVPIVAVSAYDRSTSEIEARAAGCDEFIAKPCEPDALRDVLKRLVSIASRSSSTK